MACKILLVDDEPELLASWERILRPLGHACLTASTGPDAIAFIDREALDLVVTDLRLLGGVDGLAVARHARAHVPPISVLLISAHDSDQAREAARDAGVSEFLAKPLANAAFREASSVFWETGPQDPPVARFRRGAHFGNAIPPANQPE